jgi:hypothetical protein
VTKDTHHTPLKSGWWITQAKGHSSISIGTKRTSESGFFLVF